MNFNATLIGQMLSFALFVGFCMKYVWPQIIGALEDRKTTIMEGLAAAERGRHEQKLAEKRAHQIICDAKKQANQMIVQAQLRGSNILDEAKSNAQVEGDRILVAARAQIEQEVNSARDMLRSQVGSIAVAGAAKIISREIDDNDHIYLLKELVSRI